MVSMLATGRKIIKFFIEILNLEISSLMLQGMLKLETLVFQGKWVSSQYLLKPMLEHLIICRQSKYQSKATMRKAISGQLDVLYMKCVL